jgi:hypothetical protein
LTSATHFAESIIGAMASVYDLQWSSLLAANAEAVAIVSFNEWHEGTQIEPAQPLTYGSFSYQNYEGAYGSAGGAAKGAYVTRTGFWAGKFHGN